MKFDEEGFALEKGVCTVYHTNKDGEYIDKSEETIAIGCSLPAYGYADEPPVSKQGFAIIRKNNEWSYVEDHRGMKMYSKETGQEIKIKDLGPIPSDLTSIPRPNGFYKWDEQSSNWVEDLEEKEKQFTSRKLSLIVALKNKADELAKHLLIEYPDAERISFAIQKQEALDYKSGKNLNPTFLSALAKKRNIPLDVLVEKVLIKTAAYEERVGDIVGTRQLIMDKFDTAKTEQDLDAIEKEIKDWNKEVK